MAQPGVGLSGDNGAMRRLSLLSAVLLITSPAWADRTLRFAGRAWVVKSGQGLGPGPNDWSDAPENAWVDGAGALHLKITRRGDRWSCAEIYSQEPVSYGVYRFEFQNALGHLDPNVVVAAFLYESDRQEADIEFSRWGDRDAPTNAQYVVQPSEDPQQRERFSLQADGATIHQIDWSPLGTRFTSLAADATLHEWQGPPSAVAMTAPRLRLNIWLDHGRAPQDDREAEVVVKSAARAPIAGTASSGPRRPIGAKLRGLIDRPAFDSPR